MILCGEVAADSAFVRRAATWGADAVSVAPGEMAPLKQALAAMRSSEKAPKAERIYFYIIFYLYINNIIFIYREFT